ncbi:cupin domain-containing protein [Pseudozobellia sp. WGM2]|uniref:cupin domain-containing protein n=1 Tax=Pseudozobellia sp. WGM2 TaxID=2787625 RepID=UPI001ADF16A5|nr:cupin domain-containing protein [Pseudozobellia sp. WGM2]
MKKKVEINDRNAKIILSSSKKGTKTKNSEYIFHISSYETGGKLSIYDVIFKKPGTRKNLHYHKILTETFTVLQGEFYFNIENEEFTIGKNDSVVVPPLVVHGFRAKLPNSKLQIGFADSPNRDDFFIGLAKIVNGEWMLNETEKEDFYNKYDQFNIKED